MSRKSREKQEPSKNLLSNYAVALNEKNKLETDNAMLKLENQEKTNRNNKLAAALEICKTKLIQNDDSINQLKSALKALSDERQKEKQKFEKEIDILRSNEVTLKAEIESFQKNLDLLKGHMDKTVDNLEMYKAKSKTYKEKFKSVLEILNNFAQSRGSLCDKSSQTMHRITKKLSYTRIDAQFDHRILSELFFRDQLNDPLI